MDQFNLIINQLDFHHNIQPVFNLKNKEVCGYEFLLRSNYCQNPESLFHYASENNQLVHLDKNSIGKIFNTVSEHYTLLDHYVLFINVFPATIIADSFYENLTQITSSLSIEPKKVVLEINEFQNGIDIELLKESITILKSMGFIIAMDDLGKGESSIRAFIELEPDIAKIDRYYAKDLSLSPKKQKVVQHILQVFGDETTMILEGIESEADVKAAEEIGVPFGQGFYLGKPLPLDHYLPLSMSS